MILATVFGWLSHGLVYLANIALFSLLVCGLALAIVRVSRNASLPTKYAAYLIALVVTIASPFVVGMAQFSGRSLLVVGSESDRAPRLKPAEAMPANLETLPPRVDSGPALLPGARPVGGMDEEHHAPQVPSRAEVSFTIQSGHAETLWTATEVAYWFGWAAVLVWAIGCVVEIVRLANGYVRLRHFMQYLRPIDDARVARLAQSAASQLGLCEVPLIHESDLLGTPVSIGTFRPRVVLPASMADSLNDDQVRGILLHELAHIARRDHLVGVLQHVALVAFWWNLLLHRVCVQLSILREKICDDLATRGVDSADGYAAILVEFAGCAANNRPVPTTIGILENSGCEFRERVCRLLDERRLVVTELSRRSKLGGALVAIAFLTLVAMATPRLPATAASLPEEQGDVASGAEAASDGEQPGSPDITNLDLVQRYADPPAVQWPAALVGTIVDVEGQPISGAEVKLDLKRIYEFAVGRWDELVSTQELVTDETGEYRFDTSDFPEMRHRPFSITLSATAPGYADAKTWTWYNRREYAIDEHFRRLVMVPGRVVRGRCVDPQGNPVAGAIVKIASDYDSEPTPSSWAWDPRETNEQGEFQVSVPLDTERRIEIWVVHSDWVPQRVVVPKTGEVLADVRMQKGERIEGTVFDTDGSPVAGTVVAAGSIESGDLRSVWFPVRLAVTTDAQGRYQLPPLQGLYKIFLSQAEQTDYSVNDQFAVASEPPPPVVPQMVAIAGPQPPLDFRAGPTVRISGTVRWEDGRLVEGTEVWADYVPPGFGGSIRIGQTRTNSDGNYTFEMPNPIDHLSITVIGEYDVERKWHRAYGDDRIESDYVIHNGSSIEMDGVDQDVSGLDWLLRPDRIE